MENKRKLLLWKNMTGDPVTDGFSRNPEYHEFFRQCNEVFEFRFAMEKDAYLGNGVFKNIFKYEKGRIVPAEEEFRPDVVYQFKRMTGDSFDNKVKIINTAEFRAWCGDKWNQYQLLSEFMPKTFLIENQDDYKAALEKITTQKAVLKTRRGQKGENVTVFKIENPPPLVPELLQTKGYLLQEFADTTVGIPNVVSGLHDLKLITINNHVFANLRTPDRIETEICTFDSPYTEVAIESLPPEILEFHGKVKDIVEAQYPNQIYTVDVGMTPNGPTVFELNSHTAFPYIHFEYAQDFFAAFIDLLKKY